MNRSGAGIKQRSQELLRARALEIDGHQRKNAAARESHQMRTRAKLEAADFKLESMRCCILFE